MSNDDYSRTIRSVQTHRVKYHRRGFDIKIPRRLVSKKHTQSQRAKYSTGYLSKRKIMDLQMMAQRREHTHKSFVGVAVGLLAALSLAGCASSAPVEVPPADYDRTATWQTHMVACLQEEGWDVVATHDGSLNFTEGGLPSSQYEKYADSVETCELSSGLPTWDDLSEPQRRGNYQLVAENAQCLRDQGYDLPADPSFQKYEEDQADWTPFADLDVSADELDDLEKVCPQPIGW